MFDWLYSIGVLKLLYIMCVYIENRLLVDDWVSSWKIDYQKMLIDDKQVN